MVFSIITINFYNNEYIMSGINKVILIGRLGQEPEMRATGGGMAVANITLATSESWKDKQSGEKQERTEWHKVVFFGKLGEVVGKYLRKGSLIYIEGRIQTEKWQDKDGQDRYTTKIIASEMQMLGSKLDSETSNQPAEPKKNEFDDKYKKQNPDSFDDDIPF